MVPFKCRHFLSVSRVFKSYSLKKSNLQTLATFGKMLFEHRNDCWLPSISSFLATIPQSLLDICGKPQGHLELCLHATCAGAASSFSQEHLGWALAPSIVLLEDAGKQLPQSDGPPPHPWDLRALASGFFVDRNL